MAWLEQKSGGTFHIVFRIGKQRYRKSLRTKNQKEAISRQLRIEENIRFVESGRLAVPVDADLTTFLLSDGKINNPLAGQKSVRLGEVFRCYVDSLPEGSLEANTLRIAEIHMRHFGKTIGTTLLLRHCTGPALPRADVDCHRHLWQEESQLLRLSARIGFS